MDEAPTFLNIPAEIRMLIYDLLLDNSGQKTIAIRNQRREKPKEVPGRPKALRRSSYNVLERTFYCRAYEATYGLASSADLHPAILAVNRRVRQEASHHLYGRHAFHFGEDLEAVGPFIEDKTWSTRALVRDITLHKSGLASTAKTDSCDWGSICRSLGALPKLRKLRLRVRSSAAVRDAARGPRVGEGPGPGRHARGVGDCRLQDRGADAHQQHDLHLRGLLGVD
ncbi:unnamed protein product [Clonostachys rosea f. rosea IK726]|uniref:Uncharacterized protein n=1 Tax=Clonostachys rosea f. rosea IK726 TaxID=1349383 RepID=A0ACA9U092_BIOOC|nr:unnamed protein product [Clonostachys rosea f. rosea IK726]